MERQGANPTEEMTMRRYLITACGLVIFGAYVVAQGGGDQTSAPTEARLRETVANLRAGRIVTRPITIASTPSKKRTSPASSPARAPTSAVRWA
jgi:hypothetical protein